MTFDELGLSEKVLQAVAASGYTTPTPIQAEAIPHALAGRDVLGIAQTGTGKTAAFTLPMLSRLESGRARARMPRTLILEPTRELAAQVEESFVKYGANHKINVALLIGGVSFADQEAKIMRGADVLIATPGRLLDFSERGKLLLTGIEILVIDEADRMLDMGFIPDIERICKLVPFTRQTLFFSATMPPEITRLTEQFLHNPARIEVAKAATTASTITQGIVASHSGGAKRETLRRLLRGAEGLKNAIIFCNRKSEVAVVYKSLQKHGFPVGALHGDMDQRARMASLDAFKNGAIDLLVCSDVAARGLDIPDVSHVLNFDVPSHAEDYVHRIGRTGRAGRSGVAYTIVTRSDQRAIDDIEKLIVRKIDWFGPSLADLPAAEAGTEEERPRSSRGRRERGAAAERGERGGRGRERTPRAEREPVAPRAEREDDMIEAVEAAAPAPRAPRPVKQERAPREARAPREGRAPREPRQPRQDGRSERPQREARPVADNAPQPRVPQERTPERAPERAPSQDRYQNDRGHDRRRYTNDDNDPPVIGLGDHVPSFLLRPVILKPLKATAEAEAGED